MLGHRPNTEATDRALTTLSHACRRRLLFELYEEVDSAEENAINYTGIPPFESETRQILLYHVHLPLLEESGYVEWNEAERTIQRGPRWEEIEPLLELIDSNLGELPPDLQGKPIEGYETKS